MKAPLDSKVLYEVINATPVGILVVDSNGDIQLANKALCTIFGYSESELLGSQLEMLVPVDAKSDHVEHRKGYLQNPEPRMMGQGRQLSGQHKLGQKIRVEIGLSPCKIKETTYVIATVSEAQTSS